MNLGNMKGYLGQFPVKIEETEFKDFTPSDWSMYFIERYGQIDGAHHKQWVLDQVARILKGTPVIIEEARWENGHKELRVWLDKPSQEYRDWVTSMLMDEDGNEYSYDDGIAP